ncbi:hypothetical protein C5167_031572 [Papaver somniferum]|uniref:Uncharacterized protein n=1 Tax=Papaver somniferum TaxID=3469 RepID=A0A4Y7K5W6_PAPSO|nr:hypothetical protein C5167_031572 [Papaver somniferum]
MRNVISVRYKCNYNLGRVNDNIRDWMMEDKLNGSTNLNVAAAMEESGGASVSDGVELMQYWCVVQLLTGCDIADAILVYGVCGSCVVVVVGDGGQWRWLSVAVLVSGGGGGCRRWWYAAAAVDGGSRRRWTVEVVGGGGWWWTVVVVGCGGQ